MTSTTRNYHVLSRIVDLFKGIISLALIVALVIGVPVALILIAGFPLPTKMPSIDLMRAHIEDGDIPDTFVVKTLAVVVWVVWAQLAVAVLTEVFALIRGRVAGRSPILPGIQLFAGKLVGSTVLIASALTPSRPATAVPIVPLDMVGEVGQSSIDSLSVQQVGPHGPSGAAEPQGPTFVVDEQDGSVRPAATNPAGQYATKSGDNWWDMAERLLGDGMRWSELRGLNLGRTMATGELISEQTEIVSPGWHLDVPPDADTSLLSPAPLNGDSEVDVDVDAGVGVEVEVDAAVDADEDRGDAGGGDDEVPDAVLTQAVATVDFGTVARPVILTYEGPTGVVDEGPLVPYQVVAGDNLWDIAERHLGDPFRWPEIFEHSKELEQSFGRRITDPNLIWPEAIIQLPSDAVDVPSPDPQLLLDVIGPTADDEPSSEVSEIQPEDLQEMTDAARDALGEAAVGPATVDVEALASASTLDASAGLDHQPDPDSDSDPDPGDDRPLPETPPQPPAELASEPVTESQPEPAESSNDADAYNDADVEADNDNDARLAGPAALSFGAGGLLVASGLLGMLHRARRLRLSEAAERQQPAPPPLELGEIETVLRNSADTPRSQSVYRAIRSLANRPVVLGEPVATPEVIRISRDRVEVVQRGSDSNLPAPWLVGKSPALDFLVDRSLAVLPAERFSDESDGPLEAPAPACVTIGGGLLLNLEAVGLLGITGSPEQAAGLTRSMVHELATGPGRRSIDIRVSNWLPGAELHQHVRCGSLDHLVEELASWLEEVELASAAAGGLNAYGMRLAGTSETPLRSTVVFADQADAEALQPLVERARRRSLPLAVIFVAETLDPELAIEAVVKLEAHTLKLEPHGFTAATQFLDIDVLQGAERLIDHARRAPMVARADDELAGEDDEQPTDPAQLPTEETPEHEIVTELPAEEHEITDQAEDAESGLLIRVLGSVQIEGGAADLDEAERSLLTFLALVGPSTGDQIRDAVWPAGAIDDAEFDATIERLRSQLGHRFPDLGDGRFRLRSVITDLGSARRWIAQAKSMSDERARSLLQLALAEVRGEPFSGTGERYWQWIADHKLAIATQASAMLIDACFDLCDNAYAADDIYLAKWACDVGSLIDPLHETVLTRRVQLLQIMGQTSEAEEALETWEDLYETAAGRPAPRGARAALQTAREIAPHVG